VRTIIFALLILAPLGNAFAATKSRESAKPLPLFMDPEFSFSQVETICLAPVLDLRSDKSSPLTLSGNAPGLDFSHTKNANQFAADLFKIYGYQTAACNPVTAALNDLAAPSDAWLHSLDFGSSNWLFILAVEAIRTSYSFWGEAGGFATGDAVVSGFLFEKRASGARLVWRDRAFGMIRLSNSFSGRKAKMQAYESAQEANNAIAYLLAEFEPRSKKNPPYFFAVDEESFPATCDAVWTSLADALNKDSRKYKVALLDSSDRIALYTVFHKSFMNGAFENEDHVVLKTQGNACVMQATQLFIFNAKPSDDWSELAAAIRASLSK